MYSDIAVKVTDLEKKFGDFTAVDRINFEVKKGEIFGFLGPNGAGKTTTIKMLCGLYTPTSGEGNIIGYDIVKQQRKIKQNIGYMSQKFSLYGDLTVEENIDFYGGIYRIPQDKKKERKNAVIKMAGLEHLRSNMTETLPVGWKQRLALGCAIIHEPRMIFLDEPTSGVDPISRKSFWDEIKKMAEKGVTVFVTTHYMDEAENCDRLALIYRGQIIAAGTSEELRTGYMKNDVVEISVKNPEEWIEGLETVPGINEAALFGTAIHAIVKEGTDGLSGIKEYLRNSGCNNFDVVKIQPSLEDVFVSLIEKYDRTEKNK